MLYSESKHEVWHLFLNEVYNLASVSIEKKISSVRSPGQFQFQCTRISHIHVGRLLIQLALNKRYNIRINEALPI